MTSILFLLFGDVVIDLWRRLFVFTSDREAAGTLQPPREDIICSLREPSEHTNAADRQRTLLSISMVGSFKFI